MTTEAVNEGARRVEEIDAAEHDLLRVALDETVPVWRQILTWDCLLELEAEKAELLGLDQESV